MKLQQRIKEKLLKRFGRKKCKNVQNVRCNVFWNKIEDTLVTILYNLYRIFNILYSLLFIHGRN